MRKIVVICIGLAMAILIGACARATPTPAATPTPTPIKGEGELVVFGQGTWETQYSELYIPRFEKQTGCKVTFYPGRSTDMLAKIRAEKDAPSTDVTQMDSGPHGQAKSFGLVAKNDPKIVTNLADVIEKFRDPDNEGVPAFMWGTAIAIRTDKYTQAGIPDPTSWLDLADPRLKGHVGYMTFDHTNNPPLFVLTSMALGGDYDNVEAAKKWMVEKLKPNLSMVTQSGTIRQAMIQGDVWAFPSSMHWTLARKKEGLPVKNIIPKEGVAVDLNYYEAVKNSPNPICAQLWLNFVISKEAQDLLAERFDVGPINKNAKMDLSLAGDIPYAPALGEKMFYPDWDKLRKYWPDWTDWFNRNIKG